MDSSFMLSSSIYISRGFQEMSKSVDIRNGTVFSVLDLESTQEDADTRIILQINYSVTKDSA